MGAKWLGAAVKRKEDPALLTGKGHFVDDIRLPGTLHAAFVRSAHAHARIRGIDTSAARAMPSVHLVLTFADLPQSLRINSLPLLVPHQWNAVASLPLMMRRLTPSQSTYHRKGRIASNALSCSTFTTIRCGS